MGSSFGTSDKTGQRIEFTADDYQNRSSRKDTNMKKNTDMPKTQGKLSNSPKQKRPFQEKSSLWDISRPGFEPFTSAKDTAPPRISLSDSIIFE
jgi:hypothetical protein